MKRALIADDIGLIKDLTFETSSIQLVSNQTGSGLEIVSLCLLTQEPCKVALSRVDGSLELVSFIDSNSAWKAHGTIDLDEPAAEMTYAGASLYVLTETRVLVVEAELDSLRIVKQLPLPSGPYSVVRFIRSPSSTEASARVLAVSEDAPPVIIELASGQIVWQGKNAPDTPLGLRSVFRTECMVSLSAGVFASADNTGKVRFYDTVFQRKPLLEFPVFNAFNVTNNYTGTSGMGQTRPIKQLELSPDGKTLFVGDTYGSVIALDLSKIMGPTGIKIPVPEDAKIATAKHMEYCRKLFPMRFSLPGMMGSIRSIAVTESNIYVATAGRYAYAFDMKSKGKKFDKIFMKQKLTCCLPIEFLDKPVQDDDKARPDADSEDDGSADDEALRSILDTVDSKTDEDKMSASKSKRRRLRKGVSKQ